MAGILAHKAALGQALQANVTLPPTGESRVPRDQQGRRLIRAQSGDAGDGSARWSGNPNPNPNTKAGANHGKLRLFIDSAEKEVWKTWLPTGTFHGVTTNPLLLERAQVSCDHGALRKLTQTALSLGAKEVQLQTWGADARELYRMGSHLADIDTAVVVKVPVTSIGLSAASKLVNAGARVTMTGLYSTQQVLLATGVGADYAAPYLGRMILKGKDGLQDIQDMQRILIGVGSQMRVLVASIKTVDQILTLAARGISSYALPPTIIEELLVDKDTDEAAKDFEQAAARNQYRLFL